MDKLIVLLVFLAYFNEQALEWLLGAWKPQLGKTMVFISLAVGLGESFFLKINALPLVGIDANAYFGYIVTGFAIGGLSNVLHKFVPSPLGRVSSGHCRHCRH